MLIARSTGKPREVIEGDAGVGEPCEVDGLLSADQVLDVRHGVPDVDIHAGHDASATRPERDELPLAEVAGRS